MKTTVLLLLTGLALVSSLPYRGGRIINGRETNVGDVPNMAALIVTTTQTNYFCGGSIISPNFILTAGHCLDDAVSITVVVGVTNIRDFEPTAQQQVIPASNARVHEGYNPSEGLNDIALIRMNTPLTVNEAVVPINVPRRSDVSRTWVAETGIACGWGQVSGTEAVLSDVLRWGESYIDSNNDCSSYFPGIITGNHLCATGSDGRSICNGDNGGPIIVNDDGDFKQVGIASFVHGTCESGFPGVFTRLTPYLDWIDRNTDDVVIRP